MKTFITLIVGLVAGLVMTQTFFVETDEDLAAELSTLKIENSGLQKRLKAMENLHSENTTKSTESIKASNTTAISSIPKITGTMKLSGVVVNSKNQPLSGVKITANPAIGSSGKMDQDEATYLKNMKDYYRNYKSKRFVIQSDSQGRFSFDQLPEETYTLLAELEGWVFQTHSMHSISASRDNLRIRGNRASGVKIQIAGIDKTTEKITVNYERDGSNSQHTFEKGALEGTITLAIPGKYTLKASMARLVSDPITITVKEGEFAETTLTLTQKPGIYGTVDLSALTNPNRWYQVKAVPINDGEEVSDERLINGHKLSDYVGISKDTFKFLPLNPGQYAVGIVDYNTDEVLDKTTVKITDKVEDVSLTLPKLDLSDAILITAHDSNGETPQITRIAMEIRTGNSTNSGQTTHQLGDDGIIQVIPTKAMNKFIDDGDGNVTLTLVMATHGNFKIELKQGVRSYRVSIPDPATLNIALSNVPENMTISAVMYQTNDQHRYNNQPTVIDGKGKANLGPFTPGNYKLEIIKGSQSWRSTVLLSQNVTLQAGEQSLNLSIPDLNTLTVTGVGEGLGRFSLSRQGSGMNGGNRDIQPDSKGNLVFTDLADGDYVLGAFSSSMKSMKITVHGETTVNWEGKEVNAFEFSVDSGSELEKLGFQDGDILVGMGNKRFKNFMEIMVSMEIKFDAAAKSGKKIKLLMLRGGQEVSIEVPAKGLKRLAGNSVSPASVE